MMEMLPDLADRRALLEQRLNQYKMAGFSDAMEALALEAQTPGSPAEKPKHEAAVRAHREKSKNMYAAAARMQQELDALPPEGDEPPS